MVEKKTLNMKKVISEYLILVKSCFFEKCVFLMRYFWKRIFAHLFNRRNAPPPMRKYLIV